MEGGADAPRWPLGPHAYALRMVATVVLPMYMTSLVEPAVGLAETAILGHLPDTGSAPALAAMALTSPLFNLAHEWAWDLSIAVASASAGAKSARQARALVGRTILIAAVAGTALAGVLLVGAGAAYAACAPGSIGRMAAAYAAVRALTMPTLLCSNVIEGFWYGQKDSVTPAVVYVLSSAATICALYLAAPRFGILGAAVSLVVGSFATAAMHYVALRVRAPVGASGAGAARRSDAASGGGDGSGSDSDSGSGDDGDLDTLALVRKVSASLRSGYALATISMCKIGVYGLISLSVANAGVVHATAAYKVFAEIYWTLSFTCEPSFMAASTLLPSARSEQLRTRQKLVKPTARALYAFATLVGLILAGVGASMATMPVLTSNPQVLAHLAPAAGLVSLTLFLSSFTYTTEVRAHRSRGGCGARAGFLAALLERSCGRSCASACDAAR